MRAILTTNAHLRLDQAGPGLPVETSVEATAGGYVIAVTTIGGPAGERVSISGAREDVEAYLAELLAKVQAVGGAS